MQIVLIAAIAESNNVIGKDGKLPWRIPEDLKRFKQFTTSHAVVMGRKTWETDLQRKTLPNRLNLVLSKQSHADQKVVFVRSVEEVIDQASGHEVLFVIGGANTYRQFLPLAERLEITWVSGLYQGDTFFPATQDEITKDFCLTSSQNKEEFRFSSYTRRYE